MEVFIPTFSVGYTHGYFNASLRDEEAQSLVIAGFVRMGAIEYNSPALLSNETMSGVQAGLP